MLIRGRVRFSVLYMIRVGVSIQVTIEAMICVILVLVLG